MDSTTVFTDYLKTLADYSEKVDNGEVTHTDFIEFQKLEARIIKAYQTGYFKHPEYSALTTIYSYIKDGFRIVLQLDRPGTI